MRLRAGVLALVGAALVGAPAWAQPRVKVDGDVTALAFSADGQWLAVGHEAGGAGGVSLWSMKRRGEPVELPRLGKPTAFVGFAGAHLAAADEDTLAVWDVAGGRELFRLDLRKRRAGGTARVLADPRGPRVAVVAVGAGGEGMVEVFDLEAGRTITAISRVRAERQAVWSADGAWLLLDGAAWSWDDLRSWKPKQPGLAAVEAGGKLLAYVDPATCGEVMLVEPASRKTMRRVATGDGGCPAAIWLVDGGRALMWIGGASGKPQDLWRWDADRDRVRAVRRGVSHHPAAALSPDERLLALPDGPAVRFVSTR